MKNRKRFFQIVILGLIGCIIMISLEATIMPQYLYKSMIKVAVFGSCIAVYYIMNKGTSFLELIRVKDKKQLLISLAFGIGVYCVILLGYYVFHILIEPEKITSNLLEKENISKENFLFVAVYISIVNSFLEEIFFRGFLYLEFRKYTKEILAAVVSAFLFAVYHIFIIANWFTIGMFVFLLVGLMASGLIFNFFDRKGSVLNAWILHVAANLGINTVGFILLGMV